MIFERVCAVKGFFFGWVRALTSFSETRQQSARDPGNKAADSAHVMGSGGLAVVAVAIGCLGAERRGEQFFRTWTFFNRRPPATQSEVGRSAAGHIAAIKGSDGVSPVGARQD